jgi:hypothetical protein
LYSLPRLIQKGVDTLGLGVENWNNYVENIKAIETAKWKGDGTHDKMEVISIQLGDNIIT